MIRVTMACPEAWIAEANQLALCLGLGPQDAQTYGAAEWEDAVGNRYAVASAVVGEGFLANSHAALQAPVWPVDLAAAVRMQARVALGLPAAPDHLAAMVGPTAEGALAALGLRRAPAASA